MDWRRNWQAGFEIIREWMRGRDACGDVDGFVAALEYVGEGLHAAEAVGEFNRRSGALENLRGARRRIEGIVDVLEGTQQLCVGLRSIDRIRSGVRTLQRIGSVGRDPQAAAAAFGEVLSGLGELSSHLPPPANSYADWLAACGDFFSNMRAAIDPDERWRRGGHREDWQAAGGRPGSR